MKERIITYEQRKKLESILFWRREIKLLNNYSPSIERDYSLKQADKAIQYRLEECDKLNIPFSVQNAVLMYVDVHTDIIDVLKENNIAVVV